MINIFITFYLFLFIIFYYDFFKILLFIVVILCMFIDFLSISAFFIFILSCFLLISEEIGSMFASIFIFGKGVIELSHIIVHLEGNFISVCPSIAAIIEVILSYLSTIIFMYLLLMLYFAMCMLTLMHLLYFHCFLRHLFPRISNYYSWGYNLQGSEPHFESLLKDFL